jgi:histidyl-tRNA synthetase
LELTRLRGFQDLIGPEARLVRLVEERARVIAERYALDEIRIPLLERIELYQRTTGETTDIVEKQLYTVPRREEGQESAAMALRPEGTPGVVRAYIEAGFDKNEPEQRFFYLGPMLRYERPQKGRYRQFHQFGVEIFGRADAACDAELILMLEDLGRELGLKLDFQVNSLGCSDCRPAFRAALLEYGHAHLAELCRDCHARLQRNPLRMLDCKIDAARVTESAPKSLDYLCAACREHFDLVQQSLINAGVAFEVNSKLVRGLDYYTRTAFEVFAAGLGAQSAVAAGGRYDGLVEALGGASVPGTGFAIGVERMALALQSLPSNLKPAVEVAVIGLGSACVAFAGRLARELRNLDQRVELMAPGRSLKALLRRANRVGARYAVIVGEDELARGTVQLRDLKTSTQREIPSTELIDALHSSALLHHG